jgi:hypothetical protein
LLTLITSSLTKMPSTIYSMHCLTYLVIIHSLSPSLRGIAMEPAIHDLNERFAKSFSLSPISYSTNGMLWNLTRPASHTLHPEALPLPSPSLSLVTMEHGWHAPFSNPAPLPE